MFYATRNTLSHTHTALALALSVSALSLCPSFDTRSALSDPHLGCADGCSICFHPGFLPWCFHCFSAFVDVRLDAFPARPRAQNGLCFTPLVRGDCTSSLTWAVLWQLLSPGLVHACIAAVPHTRTGRAQATHTHPPTHDPPTLRRPTAAAAASVVPRRPRYRQAGEYNCSELASDEPARVCRPLSRVCPRTGVMAHTKYQEGGGKMPGGRDPYIRQQYVVEQGPYVRNKLYTV